MSRAIRTDGVDAVEPQANPVQTGIEVERWFQNQVNQAKPQANPGGVPAPVPLSADPVRVMLWGVFGFCGLVWLVGVLNPAAVVSPTDRLAAFLGAVIALAGLARR